MATGSVYRGRFIYVDHQLLSTPHDGAEDQAILFRLRRVAAGNQRNVVTLSAAEEEYAAGSSTEISLRPVRLGDVGNIDPKAFSGPIDPARLRAMLEKALRGHRALLSELVTAFSTRPEAVCLEARDSVDLLVRAPGQPPLLIEVKTISGHPVSRVRLGLAQLYEYAYRLLPELGPNPVLVLAVDRELASPPWLLPYLTQGRGVNVITRHPKGLTVVGPNAEAITARATSITHG